MKTVGRAFIAVAVFVSLILPVAAAAKEKRVVTIAAAADLSAAFKEIGDKFEKQTGIETKLSFGASGALTQQIENGAPFDLFFSADMDYPKKLIQEGDAVQDSLFRYAVGKLVLWTPSDSPLDIENKGMNVLTDKSVQKIAIANPQHAPYGRAAVAAMKHVGLYDQVSDRLVVGENIAQAAQFVESGNAQVGFVALAHALAPGMRDKGKYWVIPAEAYPPLEQGVVLLSHAKSKKEAEAFLNFMKTKETTAILQRYGFTVTQ